MAIVTETFDCGLVRTYSDDGVKIERDGVRYDEAVDPADSGRVYIETDEPVGEPVRYSRWGIIKAIEKRGLADAFDEYLKNDNRAFRSFYGPEWFEANDERFREMVKTIRRSFELTDAQIAEILSESLYDEN